MLTKDQIADEGIISRADDPKSTNAIGWRATSYDSRIGTIITQDGEIKAADTYELPPQGIAWVISAENYSLPTNITGITTLKTTWTKKGVLTLTSGIVDPGYSGPLSTAVIHFSKTNFSLTKGDTFFRTVFFKHDDTKCKVDNIPYSVYRSTVMSDKNLSSESFLKLDAIADDVIKAAFRKPSLPVYLSLIALILAIAMTLFSVVAPPAWNMYQEIKEKNMKIELLMERVEELEKLRVVQTDKNQSVEARIYSQPVKPDSFGDKDQLDPIEADPPSSHE